MTVSGPQENFFLAHRSQKVPPMKITYEDVPFAPSKPPNIDLNFDEFCADNISQDTTQAVDAANTDGRNPPLTDAQDDPTADNLAGASSDHESDNETAGEYYNKHLRAAYCTFKGDCLK